MKKVLSLVLAAAMTLSLAATSFAATTQRYDSTTTFATVDENGNPTTKTASQIVPSAGGTWVSALSTPSGVLEGADKVELTYDFIAAGKANTTVRWGDYEPNIDIKGPADCIYSRINKETFASWPENGLTYVAFQVNITLRANDDKASGTKDIVITYGAKTDLGSRTSMKGATVKNKEWDAGYVLEVDRLYDRAVEGIDNMNAYDETAFDMDLGDTPVIPTAVMKYLQKNLSNKQSVIFTNTNGANAGTGSLYLDSATTLELSASAIKALSTSNINVKVNKSDVEDISTVLDEGKVDYTWFNYAVHRDTVGKHSLDSNYDDPHVYLINEDGTMTPVDTMDYDYGDVAFEGPMGQYVITEGAIPEDLFDTATTDEPIEDDDNLIDEPTEDDDKLVDEDGNPIENNPGTGSSNAISLAVAMAVVSLAAAGLVATKKASK